MRRNSSGGEPCTRDGSSWRPSPPSPGCSWQAWGRAAQAAVASGGGESGPACSTTGFCPPLPRDFSLHAVGLSGAGVGEVVYGRNGSGTPTQLRVVVTCVATSAGHAVLGGVVPSTGGG